MIMKSALIILAALVFVSAARAEFVISFDVDYASLALKDPTDNIYLGDEKGTGLGFGGHADWLFPLNETVSFGPNFNFAYNRIEGTWYNFSLFQPSVGPIVKFSFSSLAAYVFLNYNLGWASMEQDISSFSGNPAPAGSFAANLRGFMAGIRTQTTLSDRWGVGVYAIAGLPSLIEFKYKSLQNNQYENKWLNIDLASFQAGVSIYF